MTTSSPAQPSSSRWRPQIWVHVLLLPAAIVLNFLSFPARGLWRALFDAHVEEGENYGLGFGLVVLAMVPVIVVLWAVGWALVRRPRVMALLQVVTLLAPSAWVTSALIREALDHPAAVDRARVARRAARQAALEAAHRTYPTDLPAWLAGLPAGGTAWLPPRAPGQALLWRGRPVGPAASPTEPVYPGAFLAPAWRYPDRARPGELLLLGVPGDVNEGSGLVLLGPSGRVTQVVERGVTGAVPGPTPGTYAYSVTGVVAKLAARTAEGRLVTVDSSARVVGLHEGRYLVQQEYGRALATWLPGESAPRPLPRALAPEGERFPPRGERSLTLGWDGESLEAEVNPPGIPLRYQGTVWPLVDYPAQDGTPLLERAVHGGAGGDQVLWQGSDGLDLSPDGRYLVLADLQVLDLDTGRRTPMVGGAPQLVPATVHAGRPDLLSTGFWHDDRTVEITAGGSPVAECSLPAGPCRRTGFPVNSAPAASPSPTPPH